MREERKVCAADAGEQLRLQVEPDAAAASHKSARRQRRPVTEIATTQSGAIEPGPIGYFVIFLWLLSNEPKSPLDYAGQPFTVEEAARHHALIFEEADDE